MWFHLSHSRGKLSSSNALFVVRIDLLWQIPLIPEELLQCNVSFSPIETNPKLTLKF